MGPDRGHESLGETRAPDEDDSSLPDQGESTQHHAGYEHQWSGEDDGPRENAATEGLIEDQIIEAQCQASGDQSGYAEPGEERPAPRADPPVVEAAGEARDGECHRVDDRCTESLGGDGSHAGDGRNRVREEHGRRGGDSVEEEQPPPQSRGSLGCQPSLRERSPLRGHPPCVAGEKALGHRSGVEPLAGSRRTVHCTLSHGVLRSRRIP